MVMGNPYQKYKQNSVETASPGELTLMLYNGCIKFIKAAKKSIEDNNIEQKNDYIQKSQNIIQELMITLDQNQKISQEMLRMYDYMLYRLMEANIKNDVSILNEVEGYVTEFREIWKVVIQQNRQLQHQQGGQY